MPMISTTSALAAACTDLARSTVITVDTEFLRESTFWSKLCVVQLASTEAVYIVDALATGIDLQPLFDLLVNEDVLKVFHAARQDIEIFHNLGRVIPTPLFDTQVAAMVLGFGESISYDQLVARITGAPIDKSHRFTDWSRRPLSREQLAYAEADVTHLHDVYASLSERLLAEGRSEWVAEEMAVLTNERTYRADPQDAWLRLKMRLRKPRELIILQHIAAWRERVAQARDVPRSRVLKDDAIYEIATQAPVTTEALAELRTIPRNFERSATAGEILDEVRAALAVPKDEWPKLPRPRHAPEGASAAVELMKVLLRLTAENEGVAARVIASTDDLEAIAADVDPADIPALCGWRRELFGERALRLKRGELALSFDGRKVTAIELAPSSAQSSD